MTKTAEAKVQKELDALEHMTTAELVEKYKELHGHVCRTRHRRYLIRKVAWRIADLNERIAQGEARMQELNARSVELERQVIDPDEAAEVFAEFDAVWSNLIPREQARLLKLLIEVVHYDAANSSVAVTFRPSSIRAFMDRVKTEAA